MGIDHWPKILVHYLWPTEMSRFYKRRLPIFGECLRPQSCHKRLKSCWRRLWRYISFSFNPSTSSRQAHRRRQRGSSLSLIYILLVIYWRPWPAVRCKHNENSFEGSTTLIIGKRLLLTLVFYSILSIKIFTLFHCAPLKFNLYLDVGHYIWLQATLIPFRSIVHILEHYIWLSARVVQTLALIMSI